MQRKHLFDTNSKQICVPLSFSDVKKCFSITALFSDGARVRVRVSDSLVSGAREGVAGALDGVQAAVQPLHALVDGAKLARAQSVQLQELALVP